MIWIMVGIVAAVMLYFFMRARSAVASAPTIRHFARDAQSRSANLPAEEQDKLAKEIRLTALEGYDAIATAARSAGKDETFIHQAGVLQALSAVSSPGRQVSQADQRELQMESVPFNKVEPGEGRFAVAEYCVWKFFPARADEGLFAPLLRRFRNEMHTGQGVTEDVIFGMLYSMKYDWQRWLSDHRDEPVD